MNIDTLRTSLEEAGLDSTKIDEIISQQDSVRASLVSEGLVVSSSLVDALESQYASLPVENWKERARIRARIIALGIESG